jgi:hypothetical protein
MLLLLFSSLKLNLLSVVLISSVATLSNSWPCAIVVESATLAIVLGMPPPKMYS